MSPPFNRVLVFLATNSHLEDVLEFHLISVNSGMFRKGFVVTQAWVWEQEHRVKGQSAGCVVLG